MKTMNANWSSYVSHRFTTCLAAVAMISGCAATTPPAGADDPASAQATSAPMPEGSPSLAPTAAPSGAEPAPAEHDHSAHQHADAPAADVYTCPMHSDVRQSESGRCPKCGMNLEKVTSDEKTGE